MGGYRRRNTLRARGWDYASRASVFVTVVTHQRQALFGDVVDGEMRLSVEGQMVDEVLRHLDATSGWFRVAAYIVMPDHVHMLLDLGVGDGQRQSVSEIDRSFKQRTLAWWRDGVARGAFRPYAGRLWHRSFHDHIIRSEEDYRNHVEYIRRNPERWTGAADW